MSYAKNISFKDYRDQNKISELAAFMLVFKSCVGLGVFTYPFAFANAGYMFGGVMCVLLTYMTGYGMYCLSSLASKVEKSKFGLVKMHNYYGIEISSIWLTFSSWETSDGKIIPETKFRECDRSDGHHRVFYDQL